MTTVSTDHQTVPAYAGAQPAAVKPLPVDYRASRSGVQLAISCERWVFDDHITLLGDEDHRPYQRPALSKVPGAKPVRIVDLPPTILDRSQHHANQTSIDDIQRVSRPRLRYRLWSLGCDLPIPSPRTNSWRKSPTPRSARCTLPGVVYLRRRRCH